MNFQRVIFLLALYLPFWGNNVWAATAPTKMTIRSELAAPIILENTQDKNYLKISLVGGAREIAKRSPINLALVIDRSGSMNGDRIKKAREAAVMAVNMLNDEDTLSVITYDSVVDVIVPAAKVKNKTQLIKKIQAINSGGSTALFAGVSNGLAQVSKYLAKEQVNRIILLSDGQANVGPSAVSELAGLARIAAKKGVAITTLGIGEGYNEDLMVAIAQYSDGNHTFVQASSDLEQAFAREFNDVMSVVAQDVEVVIKTADNVIPVRLLGRDGEILGNTVTVRLNQLYANQEKYVLLEVIPPKGSNNQSKPLADVRVNYDNLSTNQQDTYNEQVMVRYTQSSEAVKQALVDEVLVDSAIQQAAMENDRAIELMEEGKVAEAKEVLNQNAKALESLSVRQPEAKVKIQENVEANKVLIDKMDNSSKEAVRKSLKEKSFDIKSQSKK